MIQQRKNIVLYLACFLYVNKQFYFRHIKSYAIHDTDFLPFLAVSAMAGPTTSTTVAD